MAIERTAYLPEINGSLPLAEKFIRNVTRRRTIHSVLLGNWTGLGEKYYRKEHGGNNANTEVFKLIRKYGYTKKWHSTDLLVGPHEFSILYDIDKYFTPYQAEILISAWLDKKSEFNLKVATFHRDKLITHAGLTHGLWTEIGKPETAQEASEALNDMFRGKMFFKRSVELGGAPNYSADPVFAHPFLEFYPSWITSEDKMPFPQIVGTKSLKTFEAEEYLNNENTPLFYLNNYVSKTWGSAALVNGEEILSLFIASGFYGDPELDATESFYTEKFYVPGTRADNLDFRVVYDPEYWNRKNLAIKLRQEAKKAKMEKDALYDDVKQSIIRY